jgi:hypothetical protein
MRYGDNLVGRHSPVVEMEEGDPYQLGMVFAGPATGDKNKEGQLPWLVFFKYKNSY